MNYKDQNTKRNPRARTLVLVVSSVAFLLAGAQRLAAQQYYDSFSRMQSLTSMWQSNFYNDIIRANGTRSSLRSVAQAQRVTPQEIRNLCGPFPCGLEPAPSSVPSRPGPAAPSAASPRPVQPPQCTITATDLRPVGNRIVPDEMARTPNGTAEEKALLRNLSNQFLDAFEKE